MHIALLPYPPPTGVLLFLYSCVRMGSALMVGVRWIEPLWTLRPIALPKRAEVFWRNRLTHSAMLGAKVGLGIVLFSNTLISSFGCGSTLGHSCYACLTPGKLCSGTFRFHRRSMSWVSMVNAAFTIGMIARVVTSASGGALRSRTRSVSVSGNAR